MRIKLHNSMGKKHEKNGLRFLFDNRLFIGGDNDVLYLKHQIDDWNYFLTFSPERKEFFEWLGFGEKRKSDSEWWKDSCYQWKEMGK